MHSTPSRNKFENYGNDAAVMMTIARSKVNGLISDFVDRVYSERTQAEVQTQIEEALVDMLPLGNNAVSTGLKTASVRFLETTIIELFSRGAADNVMLDWSDLSSGTDTFMKAVVTRVMSDSLIVLPMVGYIKQQVNATID